MDDTDGFEEVRAGSTRREIRQLSRRDRAVDKLPSLPKDLRTAKRPLLHPPIPSPYSGRQSPKVVYVSSKTPFMSAVKRVQQLLKEIDKRAAQSIVSQRKKPGVKGSRAATSRVDLPEPEPVKIKATGKAIDKALKIALFFQAQDNVSIKIETGTMSAIDDIVQKQKYNIRPSNAENNATIDESAMIEDDGANAKNAATIVGSSVESTIKPEEFPEARIRQTSVLEVEVTLRQQD